MIKPADFFTAEVLDEFFPPEGVREGFGLRWDKCREIWFGRGEMSVWTGYNGHGKSMFLNQVMIEAICSGEKVCIGSYEMTPKRTLRRMVTQSTGKAELDALEISHCLEWLAKSLKIHRHLGQIKLTAMLDLFKKEIDEGATQIVIDSLMKLGMNEDDYNAQKIAADQLQALAQKTGCHVHLIAHPRKGINEAEIPGKMDIAGTGTISNMADNVFTVWRNKHKWDLFEQYQDGESLPKGMTYSEVMAMADAVLFCSKCRDNPEAEKKYGLYYHRGAMQYNDKQVIEGYKYHELCPF